ncbi:alpha/beta hydrolase [Catenulispora subtropica]|uniref:Esterase n=1 Tax=Catenulispora subtropica TaxID=450798 RepID=A0ABN2SL31_9ACTN
MTLTGMPLLLLAVCIAVAAPVGTYVLWNRLRGPRPVRAAARFGLIGLCQATVLLLAGLLINNHFGLYASWNDLLGRDGGGAVALHQATRPLTDLNKGGPGGTTSQGQLPLGGSGQGAHAPRTGGSQQSVLPVPSGPKQSFVPGGHGTRVASFRGPLSGVGGTGGDVYVWLPPQYNDPAYANTRFPVVMLFPGTPGTAGAWFSVLGGGDELGNALARQQATPFVLVAVNVNQHGVNVNCSDIPGGTRMATYIAQDVRTMIEANFRVSTQRTGWGLMGFSDGGLCAGKLLLQYPQYFRSAVQMAGDSAPDSSQVVRAGQDFVDQNTTLWLLTHRHPGPDQPVSLLAAVSDQDPDSLPVAFQLQAAAPDIVSVSEHARGAHNTAVWRSWLPEMYAWLSQHLDRATPSS